MNMIGIPLREFKEGSIIWWSTEHWNNPCIIYEVNYDRGTFKVFDLNDIRVTGDIVLGKRSCCKASPLTEMRFPTEEEYFKWLDDKIESMQMRDRKFEPTDAFAELEYAFRRQLNLLAALKTNYYNAIDIVKEYVESEKKF